MSHFNSKSVEQKLNFLFTQIKQTVAKTEANTTNSFLTRKISLTAAQVKTLGATPIDAIVAPGAGKVINVLSVIANLVYGTTAFDANDVTIAVDGGSTLATLTSLLDSVADTAKRGALSAPVDNDIVANAKVVIGGTDSVATGDSPLDIYITYEVVTL